MKPEMPLHWSTSCKWSILKVLKILIDYKTIIPYKIFRNICSS